MGDQREVREYQGYISFDSVARRETHELANDREAESDIRRVVTRGVGQSGRTRMQEMGSWFRDARSRQALDRIRSKHGSLRKFLQKEQKLLVYRDQQDNWCIRMRDCTGRVGMEQQGITRKGLLRRRTQVMLRQWREGISAEICQIKRSGYGSGSRWSSCSLWISRAIAKTMEERLRTLELQRAADQAEIARLRGMAQHIKRNHEEYAKINVELRRDVYGGAARSSSR